LRSNASNPILLVEDNPDDLFFMQRALGKTGLLDRLVAVADGQEAISYLSGTGKFANRAKHPLPALVLLDLQLPYFTGLEVLEWAREQPQLSEVPIVVLSSSQQRSDQERAFALGARAYFPKPTEPGLLGELIEQLRCEYLQG